MLRGNMNRDEEKVVLIVFWVLVAVILSYRLSVGAPLHPPRTPALVTRTNNVPDDSNRVILVKLKNRAPAAPLTLDMPGQSFKLEPVGKRLRWHQHVVPPGQDKHATIKRFQNSGLFEHVMEPRIYKTQETPNDPRYSELWGLTNIQANLAWDTIRDATNVVVAVVDTGIDFSHPDLVGNLWTGPNGEHGYVATNGTVIPGGLDDHGHGTHVAGTIGAVGNNAIGVAGLAWKTRIMAMKVLHHGSGNSVDIANGLEKLVELKESGVPVLVSNHSYGGGGADPLMEDAFSMLADADIFCAVAAGNSNQDIDVNVFHPASFPFLNMVVATASDSLGRKATFSNFGIVGTDIAAPGVSILSTTRSNTYTRFSGTSMAAPHVAGLATLLRQQAPNLKATQIRDVILNPASSDFSTNFWQNNTSARINAAKALANLGAPSNRPPVITSVSPYTLIPDTKPVLLTANAHDPDGNPLTWSSSQTSAQSFIKNLMARNGFTTQTGDGAVAVSGNPFAYQTASEIRLSVSDGRGGAASTNTGFEFALDRSLRRTIPIKTWSVRTNAAAWDLVNWTLDVEGTNQADYSYIILFGFPGGNTSYFYGGTPSPTEQAASMGRSSSDFSMRLFMMDKWLNWTNTSLIYFPPDKPGKVQCVVSMTTNESNVPFVGTFDMTKSLGVFTTAFVGDAFERTAFSNGKFIQEYPFENPAVRIMFCQVWNFNTGDSDTVLQPIFASRFLGVGPPPQIATLTIQGSDQVTGPWNQLTNTTKIVVSEPSKFYRLNIEK